MNDSDISQTVVIISVQHQRRKETATFMWVQSLLGQVPCLQSAGTKGTVACSSHTTAADSNRTGSCQERQSAINLWLRSQPPLYTESESPSDGYIYS